ncbi:MAG: ferrous iron transport protein B [Alcanivorax sp.]|nr:ferrous iron transport protein B [Alcanivorax sp.]
MDVAVDLTRLALVGNPNCGKTALFNALTGSRQKVANYAGVTVERKAGTFTTPAGKSVHILDLPGTYSLRARSPDERVTRDAVLGQLAGEQSLDAFICVADATNLRLMLRLVLELKQVGRPIVLALNMYDLARRQGCEIDVARLSAALGVPVVPTVAVKRDGTDALLEAIDALPAERQTQVSQWQEPDAGAVRSTHKRVEQILADCVTVPDNADRFTTRVDRVLLHPVAGLLVLFTVLFLMFQAVFTWAAPLMDMITALFDGAGALVQQYMPPGMLQSLISDGIIAGLGGVLVFLPQIMILFLFIILLEDFGYMARAAFLMDKLMGGAGLHGRAFIPLLSSFACAIPGIMGTRVISSWRDRLVTILVAPLMTCSARIPVYTLIIGAFIPRGKIAGMIDQQGLVMFGLYAAGIVSALTVATVMRLFFWRGKSEPFIMELPGYKVPDVRNVLRGVLQRGQIFLRRAGTIIFAMMVVIWFLSTFPGAPEGATEPAINYSLAGMIGHAIEPLLAPIGFNWQIAIALITGMAAREVAVAALGTVYAVGGEQAGGALGALLAAQWSLPVGLSFLAWYIFAPQCASTLAVVKRETNSWRWPLIMFGYLVTLAYAASYLVYHGAMLVWGG